MDVCIVEDGVGTMSNEDIVKNWDAKFSRKLASKLAVCQNAKIFQETLQDYCRVLQEYAINFRAKKLLKEKILNHIKVFHFHYVQNDGSGLDMGNYLDYMEKLLIIFCNLEFEVVYHIKKTASIKEYSKTIKQIAQEMIYVLTFYLLKNEQRTFHVLLKLDYDTNMESWKDVMLLVFKFFLISSPLKDSSILSFCRSYLLFQKWKCIENPSTHAGIDKIMYLRFNMTPESVKNNAITRKLLLPSTTSFIGIVDILTNSWETSVNSYLKYVEVKTQEEDEIYLHSINLDSDEEENMVESIFTQTERENRRTNKVKNEKVTYETVNCNEIPSTNGNVVYVIDDDSDTEDVSIVNEKCKENRTSEAQGSQIVSYLDSITLLDDNSNNSVDMPIPTTTVGTEPESELTSNKSDPFSNNSLISVYLDTYCSDKNILNVDQEKTKTTTLTDKIPDNSQNTENTKINLTMDDTSSYDDNLKCLNNLSLNNSKSQCELENENADATNISISKENTELSVMEVDNNIDAYILPTVLMTPPPSDRIGDEICLESLESFTSRLHNSSSKIIESTCNGPDTPSEMSLLEDSNDKEGLQVENSTAVEENLIMEESLEIDELNRKEDSAPPLETNISKTVEKISKPTDEIVNDNMITEEVPGAIPNQNVNENTISFNMLEETTGPILNTSEPVFNMNELVPRLNELILESREPITDSSDPVLELSEAIRESNEIVNKSNEPILESSEPAIDLNEPVLEPNEPVLESNESVLESSEPVFESSEPVFNPSEPVLDASKVILESNESVFNPSEPVLDASKVILESNESVFSQREPVFESSESVLNLNDPILESSELVLHSSNPVFVTSESIVDSTEPVLVENESILMESDPVLVASETVIVESDIVVASDTVVVESRPTLDTIEPALVASEPVFEPGESILNLSEPVFESNNQIINSNSSVEKSQCQRRNLSINSTSKKIKKTRQKTNNINIEKIDKSLYNNKIVKGVKQKTSKQMKKCTTINKVLKDDSTHLGNNKNSKDSKKYQHNINDVTYKTVSPNINQEKFNFSNTIETIHKIGELEDENIILKDTKKIHHKNTVANSNSNKHVHNMYLRDDKLNIDTSVDKFKSYSDKNVKQLEKINRRKSIDCNLSFIEFEKSLLNNGAIDDNKIAKKCKKNNNKNTTDSEKIGKIHYSILDKEETKKAYKNNLSDHNLNVEENYNSHYTYKIHDNKNSKNAKKDDQQVPDPHAPLEKIEKLRIKIEKVPTSIKAVENNKNPKKAKKTGHKTYLEKIDANLEQIKKSQLKNVKNYSNLDKIEKFPRNTYTTSKSRTSRNTKRTYNGAKANKHFERESLPVNINLDEMRKSLYKNMASKFELTSHDYVTANDINSLRVIHHTNNKIENLSGRNNVIMGKTEKNRSINNVHLENNVKNYFSTNLLTEIENSNNQILSDYVINYNENLGKMHTSKEKLIHTSTIKEVNSNKYTDFSHLEVVEPVLYNDQVDILHESDRENSNNNEDDYNSTDMDIEQLTPTEIMFNDDLPHNEIIVRTENTSEEMNSLSENLLTQNYNKEYTSSFGTESNFSKETFIKEIFPNLNTESVQTSTCKIQASVCMPQLHDEKPNRTPRRKSTDYLSSSERNSKNTTITSQKCKDNSLSALSDFDRSLYEPMESTKNNTLPLSNNDIYCSNSSINKHNYPSENSPDEVSPPYEDIQAQEYQAHILKVNDEGFKCKTNFPKKPIRSIIVGSTRKRRQFLESLLSKKQRVNFGSVDIRIIPKEINRVDDVFIEEARESMLEYRVGVDDPKLCFLEPQVKVQLDSASQIFAKKQGLLVNYVFYQKRRLDAAINSCILKRIDFYKTEDGVGSIFVEIKEDVSSDPSSVDLPSKSSSSNNYEKEGKTLCRIDFTSSGAHDLLRATVIRTTSDSSVNIVNQASLSDASNETLSKNAFIINYTLSDEALSIIEKELFGTALSINEKTLFIDALSINEKTVINDDIIVNEKTLPSNELSINEQIHPDVALSINEKIHPDVALSINEKIHPNISLSINKKIHPNVALSINEKIHPNVALSINEKRLSNDTLNTNNITFSNDALNTIDNNSNLDVLNLSLSSSKDTSRNIVIPDSEFSNSPKFSDADQIVKQCLMDKVLESNDLDECCNFNNNNNNNSSKLFLSNNSNFYINSDKVNMLNNTVKVEPCGCSLQAICNFCKVSVETDSKNSETKTNLPIKKRKVPPVDVSEQLNKKMKPLIEEISYPATPMISIAEIEALKQNHAPPNINVKIPIQHTEIPTLPALYNLNSVDPSPIITDQFNINNHTYNNPTINYHMNNVPVSSIPPIPSLPSLPSMYHTTFVPYAPYYSLPQFVLPLNNLHTFDNQSNIYTTDDKQQMPPSKVVKKEKKEKKIPKNKCSIDPYPKFA